MTDQKQRFSEQFSKCPIVAILRGLTPGTAERVSGALYEAGFRIIEVPLNSPQPCQSIEVMKRTLPSDAVIGAGTVTTVADVKSVADAGGEIIVSPNTNPEVIKATLEHGMISGPGCLTPTDVFAAMQAGAHALKIFPASVIGASGIKAIGDTLPDDATVIAVGGVNADNMRDYAKAGAAGFGLGASLFTPGIDHDELVRRANTFVKAASLALGETM